MISRSEEEGKKSQGALEIAQKAVYQKYTGKTGKLGGSSPLIPWRFGF